MDKIDNIYVINMDKSINRLQKITKKLNKLNKNFTRISAVNGEDLTKMDKLKNCTWFGRNCCTSSIIGCYMSHKKTWQTMINNNDKYALILEDDCNFVKSFDKDFQNALHELFINQPDWDFLYCGYFGPYKKQLPKPNIITCLQSMFLEKVSSPDHIYEGKYTYIPLSPVGFHCYVISQSCAKKLLHYMDKINYHIDVEFLKHAKKFKVFATKKKLAIQSSNSDNSNLTEKYPIILNKYFDNYIDDNNISFSYYFGLPIVRLGDFNVNLYYIFFVILTVIFIYIRLHILFLLTALLYFFYEITLDSKNINSATVWIATLYIINRAFLLSMLRN